MTLANLITIGISLLIVVAGGISIFSYSRFKADQNQRDIYDIKHKDLPELSSKLDSEKDRISGIYEKIADKLSSRDERLMSKLDQGFERIYSTIDDMKEKVRYADTCDTFRAECKDRHSRQ